MFIDSHAINDGYICNSVCTGSFLVLFTSKLVADNKYRFLSSLLLTSVSLNVYRCDLWMRAIEVVLFYYTCSVL